MAQRIRGLPQKGTSLKMKTRESNEQASLMVWAAYQAGRFPELELLYHIPNGGSRNSIEAYHLKEQGVKAGVPDLCLPVARGAFHGLYIELKIKGNKPTTKQRDWIERLREQGYKAEVCYGWEEASGVILDYLNLKKA